MSGNQNRTNCNDSSSDRACKDPSSPQNQIVYPSPDIENIISSQTKVWYNDSHWYWKKDKIKTVIDQVDYIIIL